MLGVLALDHLALYEKSMHGYEGTGGWGWDKSAAARFQGFVTSVAAACRLALGLHVRMISCALKDQERLGPWGVSLCSLKCLDDCLRIMVPHVRGTPCRMSPIKIPACNQQLIG